jgi:hypothetical protein
MEAKLADVHDYARLKRKYKALRKKLDATSENAEDSAII